MDLAQINFGSLYGELGSGWRFGQNPSVGGIITALLPYLFTLAGLLVLVFLLYGGLSLMLSRGDPKATAAAHDKITYAIIGFVVILTSFLLIQIIGRFLNIEAIQNIFG